MYAHQVVSDLSSLINRDIHLDVKNFLTSYINNINSCHKFHFGKINSIYSVVDKKESSIMKFYNEYKQYIKLPYNRCWIDYYYTSDNGSFKTGVYAWNDKNHIYMLPTFYIEGAWRTPMGRGLIDFKHNLCGHQLIDDEIKKMMEFKEGHEDLAVTFTRSAMFSVMTSLVLLNCKNITTQKIIPSKSLNKKREKKNKSKIFEYYILKLQFNKTEKKQKNMLPLYSNRIHFCRGHFKKYTLKNPLFGKYTGLYWWQSHVRGRNKKGMIIKDYKI